VLPRKKCVARVPKYERKRFSENHPTVLKLGQKPSGLRFPNPKHAVSHQKVLAVLHFPPCTLLGVIVPKLGLGS
jgi:hypothetical protein